MILKNKLLSAAMIAGCLTLSACTREGEVSSDRTKESATVLSSEEKTETTEAVSEITTEEITTEEATTEEVTTEEETTEEVTSEETSETTTDAEETTEEETQPPRQIRVATFYNVDYDSNTKVPEDIYNVNDEAAKELMLENMRRIEEKYNVELIFCNVTWDGMKSILTPYDAPGINDFDAYLTDYLIAMPVAYRGHFLPLSDYISKDDDMFTKQEIVYPFKAADMEEYYMFSRVPNMSDAVYLLGYNYDMIREANLENPQDLYDRGEWTWDVFMDYMLTLTKDVDGDGITDVYGYTGFWTNLLSSMLGSNAAEIAGTRTQHLNDPKTVKVLEFIHKMYQEQKVARPWNFDDWYDNNNAYVDGKAAFWNFAAWIADQNKDNELPFEFGVVPYPIGEDATYDTYKAAESAGEGYAIPVGTEDPELVYKVLFEWLNWYDYDKDLYGCDDWTRERVTSPRAEDPERNYNILRYMSGLKRYDNWSQLPIAEDLTGYFFRDLSLEELLSEESLTYLQKMMDELN